MRLVSFCGKTLPPDLLTFALRLVKTNMRQMYDEVWGWSDAKKRAELQDEAARCVGGCCERCAVVAHVVVVVFRFIFVIDEETEEPLAFAHFRFMVEGNYVKTTEKAEVATAMHATVDVIVDVMIVCAVRGGCEGSLDDEGITMFSPDIITIDSTTRTQPR